MLLSGGFPRTGSAMNTSLPGNLHLLLTFLFIEHILYLLLVGLLFYRRTMGLGALCITEIISSTNIV